MNSNVTTLLQKRYLCKANDKEQLLHTHRLQCAANLLIAFFTYK